MSATGSPDTSLILEISKSAPISFNALKSPVLVGFNPTSLIVTSESLISIAPTIKNAADEKSPGT